MERHQHGTFKYTHQSETMYVETEIVPAVKGKDGNVWMGPPSCGGEGVGG